MALALAGGGCRNDQPTTPTTTPPSSLVNRAYIVARDSDDVTVIYGSAWAGVPRAGAGSAGRGGVARPAHVSVVVTGRNAPEALLAAADLVTEMQSRKHPFEQGRRAQIGIDF